MRDHDGLDEVITMPGMRIRCHGAGTSLQAKFCIAGDDWHAETVGGLPNAVIEGQHREIRDGLANGQSAGEMDCVQGAHRLRRKGPPRALKDLSSRASTVHRAATALSRACRSTASAS